MALKLTFFDEDGRRLEEGLTLELLENNDVIAEATTSAEGEVSFDAEPGEGEIAVRVKVESLEISGEAL